MRIGDLIECSNERDLKQTMNALEWGGFNVDRIGVLSLRVIEVPEMEYLVECYGLSFPSNAYCETKEEAEEVFEERIKTCEKVCILVGYPGEWDLVKEWSKK